MTDFDVFERENLYLRVVKNRDNEHWVTWCYYDAVVDEMYIVHTAYCPTREDIERYGSDKEACLIFLADNSVTEEKEEYSLEELNGEKELSTLVALSGNYIEIKRGMDLKNPKTIVPTVYDEKVIRYGKV